MENTVIVDSSLILLAIIGGWMLGNIMYRNRQTPVSWFTLFLVNFAALWCMFNWIAHVIAVLAVNVQRIMAGSFVYTFPFYAMLLMGITFIALSVLQLSRIRQLSQGKHYLRKQLTLVSWSIVALSLPIVPLNPIGLLPVISSVIILATVSLTKSQWKPAAFQEHSNTIVSA
ncbi:hypothetical protein Q4E40_15920 [Pontibacter sp. BT731]|uniref:hypothetical protein n=1 Tax=Pontibacter coccineus TaxID=3063328 RepID=UPI0026E11C33|nr:hypothetical protein [Pontibacter sp. BT731]MDO6391625.1 hypothetical protein [Pontibacter sp. BT731]